MYRGALAALRGLERQVRLLSVRMWVRAGLNRNVF